MIPGITKDSWSLAEALYGFTASFLAMRYDEPKPIPEVHLEWWSLCFTDHPSVAIAAPRDHAKSTAITFAFALFVLCMRMFRHILIIGANESLAAAFVNDIKVELEENEALRQQFGIKKFLKASETEIIVQFKDGQKFRVICKGSGQKMRGLKWERKRPDLVLFDDMEDDETVLTEGQREKFRRWFFGAVRPIMKSGGKIRGVGTILGFDSLLERFMPPAKNTPQMLEEGRETVFEPLRTYSKDMNRGWLSVKYRAHDPHFEHVLWPEQHSAEKLKKLRQEFAEVGLLDLYGQEYLNEPLDESVAYYRKTDFLEMKPEHFQTRKTYFAACDFAISEKDRSAFSVIVVGGLDADGFLNIVDVRRGRWDGLQICEELFSVNSRWNPEVIRIEEENIARSIGAFLYQMMDEKQDYLPIDTKTPTKDKDKRSKSMQARMRAGKVRFDKEAEWYADLEEELRKYPRFQYRDQFDAMGWLGLMLTEMVDPQTDEEVEDEAWFTEFGDDLDEGQCEVTGY